MLGKRKEKGVADRLKDMKELYLDLSQLRRDVHDMEFKGYDSKDNFHNGNYLDKKKRLERLNIAYSSYWFPMRALRFASSLFEPQKQNA